MQERIGECSVFFLSNSANQGGLKDALHEKTQDNEPRAKVLFTDNFFLFTSRRLVRGQREKLLFTAALNVFAIEDFRVNISGPNRIADSAVLKRAPILTKPRLQGNIRYSVPKRVSLIRIL